MPGGTHVSWWGWVVGWDVPRGWWRSSWNETSLESPKAVAVLGQWKWRAGAQWEHREAVPVHFTHTALILAARTAKSHEGQFTSARRNWSFKFSQQVEGRDQASGCRVIYKTQCHRNSLF